MFGCFTIFYIYYYSGSSISAIARKLNTRKERVRRLINKDKDLLSIKNNNRYEAYKQAKEDMKQEKLISYSYLQSMLKIK